MKKELRQYQKDAIKAACDALRDGEVPYLNISTGGGKSLVLAHFIEMALRQGKRVLTLTPSTELCSQNYVEAIEYVSEPHKIGICSAQLNKFQTSRQACIATYTSFLRRRTKTGSWDLLLIDECQYLSPSPDSSYQKIIKSLKRINPKLMLIGVSATPFRAECGALENDCAIGKATFTKCAYTTSIPDLIQSGFLSHVVSISDDIQVDLDGVDIKGGDYDQEQASVKFEAILPNAIPDIKAKIEAYDLKTILIFASSIKNAKQIIKEWGDDNIRLVHGEMSKAERDSTIKWLKHGEGVRACVNVNILLVGFNFQALDAIVFLRATKSLALYLQAVGRVIRASDGKSCGYVIDFSGNIDRHGPVDNVNVPKPKRRKGDTPRKLCTATLDDDIEFEGIKYIKGQNCNYANILSAKTCKKCSAQFISINEEGDYKMRTRAEILQAKLDIKTEHHDVSKVTYYKHSKLGSPDMIRMTFWSNNQLEIHSHYLLLDHSGFARDNSLRFLMKLFKDTHDYYKLLNGQIEINVDNMLVLLENSPEFFKTIMGIEIMPQRKNPKYFEIRNLIF